VLAYVDQVGAAVLPSPRVEAVSKGVLTVGAGCQFETLQEAVNYATKAAVATADGTRWRIVVMNDLTLASSVTLPSADVHIQGATRATVLQSSFSGAIFLFPTLTLAESLPVFENFDIHLSTGKTFSNKAEPFAYGELRNCAVHDSSAGTLQRVFFENSSTTLLSTMRSRGSSSTRRSLAERLRYGWTPSPSSPVPASRCSSEWSEQTQG
jgi:hypothetical protein